MASVLRRTSKFRHVFGTEEKAENQFHNIRMTNSAFDSNYIKANSSFIAVNWHSGGGGSFAVIPTSQTGKLPSDIPLFSGHAGAVQDFDFSPFDDTIIASSSEDCTVKVWRIPQGGPTETIVDPLLTLSGHQKKVGIINWHPVALNVLASTGADGSVKFWDVEAGQSRCEINDCQDLIQSISWSYDGSFAATTSKDKLMRLIDPRGNATVASVEAHPSARGARVICLGRKERLVTVGFSRTSERCFSIWDPRNLSEPMATQALDNSAGMLMPFYDDDTGILFLAGKGDGNIKYYEMIDEAPYWYFLSEFRSPTPQRGFAFAPKQACDVMKCEIARTYKLTNTSVIPLSFTVPRRSELFQDDIFPDTASNEPNMTADEWFSGVNRAPKLQNLRPDGVTVQQQARVSLAVSTPPQPVRQVTPVAVSSPAPVHTPVNSTPVATPEKDTHAYTAPAASVESTSTSASEAQWQKEKAILVQRANEAIAENKLLKARVDYLEVKLRRCDIDFI